MSKGPKDEQFTKRKDGISDRGSLKKTPGEPFNFNSQELSNAMKIMREIAKAAQGPGPDQEYQGDKEVSEPTSPEQDKAFKASNDKNAQGRSKTQVSQKIPKKG